MNRQQHKSFIMISVYVTAKSKKLREDFCSSIEKSNSAKVTDTFDTLKECRKKLSTKLPDILLLGLDLPDGYWIDFCTDIQKTYPDLKILAITSYDEYTIFKNPLNSLTSGFISKDALPKVIIAAIHEVMEGNFFRYDKIVAQEKDDENSDPEFLQTMIREMTEKLTKDNDHGEMIEKLSLLIHTIEKNRRTLIKNLIENEKDHLDPNTVDRYLMLLIESLLIKGHSNWEIADILNISIETVRLYRMEFVLKLSGKNSMVLAVKKDGEPIKLARREHQLLRLIAAGYTNQEIAVNILYVDVETVKTLRKNLIQKFEAKSTMSMVINALRLGMLKIEDLDDL